MKSPSLPPAAAHWVNLDYRVHVSDRLLDQHDSQFLELGLMKIAGETIRLPRRTADYPDRDRLALRFEHFKRAE